MRYRQLGRTGLEVSEVGFGAWGIGGGWGSTSDDESVRALHRAIDRGVTFIDTAHGYGHGHSERIVGSVVRERQERIVVATKVPPANRRWPADPDTPIDEAMPEGYLTRITLESLERLGMERVDVQQLHVWAERWLHEGSWLDELAQLKRDGRTPQRPAGGRSSADAELSRPSRQTAVRVNIDRDRGEGALG